MKKIFTLVILLLIIVPYSVGASKKGDLRCNPDNKTSCKEIKNSNGEVIQTDVTSGSLDKEGDIQIIKHVKKTETIGEFKVWFTIKGKGIKSQNKYKKTKIVLILDMSHTVEDSIREITSATKKFYNSFKDIDEIQISIIQFATNAKKININNGNFELCGYNDTKSGCKLKTKSHVEKALKIANNELSGEDQKYIVLLGDGQYWSENDTETDDAVFWFINLNNNGVKFFMIQYEGGESEYSEMRKCAKGSKASKRRFDLGCKSGYSNKNPVQYNGAYISTYIKPVKWWCKYDIGSGSFRDRYWCTNNSVINSYEEVFNSVVNEIKENVKNDNAVDATLSDRLGEEFTILDTTLKEKNMKIDKITESGIDTPAFNIVIDSMAESDKWHDTNNGFTLSLPNDNNIGCNDNPEVYWIQTKLSCENAINEPVVNEIKGCSGQSPSINNTITTNCGANDLHYTITCLEGYQDNGKDIPGYTANININNITKNENKFNIKSGLGFPINISLNTNIYCKYEFNETNFNKDYQYVLNSINITKDSKKRYSLEQLKINLENELISYQEKLKNLEDYQNRFNEQTATLKVNYNEKITDIQQFKNKSVSDSEIKCVTTKKSTVNSQEIESKECYLSMNKKMELESVCLDIKTGKVEKCTSSNTQLSGGNKYYTSLTEKEGSVFVNISDAGYDNNLTINLTGCTTSSDKTGFNVVLRQIELSDPFLKSYTNSKREIGKNYLNTKYDFVSIIKPDIWSLSTGDYKFSLSKINVSNIRHDTDNLGVSSYLGSDCYINNLNKYVCNFFEDSEKNNFFTNIEK